MQKEEIKQRYELANIHKALARLDAVKMLVASYGKDEVFKTDDEPLVCGYFVHAVYIDCEHLYDVSISVHDKDTLTALNVFDESTPLDLILGLIN